MTDRRTKAIAISPTLFFLKSVGIKIDGYKKITIFSSNICLYGRMLCVIMVNVLKFPTVYIVACLSQKPKNMADPDQQLLKTQSDQGLPYAPLLF